MSFDEPLDTTESCDTWSESLRTAAPRLPASLKGRTLARCETAIAARTQRQRRGQRLWTWAFAGVLAGQWLLVSYFDAQNAALLHGPARQNYSYNSSGAVPPGAVVTAIRRRWWEMPSPRATPKIRSAAEPG